MYTSIHTSLRFSEDLPRINTSDYVRAFTRHIEQTQGRTIRGHHLGEALHLQELLHVSENTSSKSLRDMQTGEYFWGQQKLALVPSNLGRGKGFNWYFICNGCQKRVKYLYEQSTLRSPLCRVCCRLGYHQPNRKARTLSRLIRKPYISTETKWAIIKHAGITRADIPEVLP